MHEYKVDDIVYEPYNPKNYGRVLKVEERYDNPFNAMFLDASGNPLPPVYDKEPNIYCLGRSNAGRAEASITVNIIAVISFSRYFIITNALV